MSGHGGGGGGGGGGDGTPNCASLIFEAPLSSPVDDVVANLKRGDTLSVRRGPGSGKSLVAVTQSGRTAGAIVSSQQARLVACLEEGFEYVALVKSLSGGAVDLQVRPA